MGARPITKPPRHAFDVACDNSIKEWAARWPPKMRDNPEAVEEFLGYLERGVSLSTAAALVGFALGVVMQARADVPEFETAVARRVARANEKAVLTVMNSIEGGDARTAVRFLESAESAVWSPTQRVQVEDVARVILMPAKGERPGPLPEVS